VFARSGKLSCCRYSVQQEGQAAKACCTPATQQQKQQQRHLRHAPHGLATHQHSTAPTHPARPTHPPVRNMDHPMMGMRKLEVLEMNLKSRCRWNSV
jgi:hypothetical protein